MDFDTNRGGELQRVHNGAVPLALGYEIYPVKNFGFNLVGLVSALTLISEDASAGLTTPGVGRFERNTTQVGIKAISKFWITDVFDGFTLGFETGFGAVRYRFLDYYEIFLNNGIRENGVKTALWLTPIHFGVNLRLTPYLEFGGQYNYFPSIDQINEPYRPFPNNPEIALTAPNFYQSFFSFSFRAFIIN